MMSRIRQKYRQTKKTQNADRQVDIEHVAPAVTVGEPAADHWTQNGPGHHSEPEQCHCGPLAFAGIDVDQHGLRQRDEGGAERALQDTKQNDLGE